MGLLSEFGFCVSDGWERGGIPKGGSFQEGRGMRLDGVLENIHIVT